MASARAEHPRALFQRLPPGQHGLAREEVERNQRKRLQGAMVSAVAEHGYAKTKIRDLARLAGVSPNAFYEHYASKEECFLATHDAIAERAIERVSAAAQAEGDWQDRLHGAVAAFIGAVVSEPDAAYLAVVETHAVGGLALERQQRVLDAYEAMVRHCLAPAPHAGAISDTTVKAIVSGTRSLVYHHLSERRPQQLQALGEPIFRWMLAYHSDTAARLPEPPSARANRRVRAARGGGARGAGAAARAGAGHRERIMRAVAAVSAEHGYAALTIPTITSAAGVSNQTFYEHFRNKDEAFLACYDRATRRALGVTLTSFQSAPSWPLAIRASLETLLDFIAAHPEFARLAFFEVLAAGPAARQRAKARMEGFSALLDPGFLDGANAPPRVVAALVAGGTWGVIQAHIARGQTARLGELAPQLTYFALTPFLGAEEASAVALGGQRRPV
jgi:AcrR family transcriptional regulator